MTNIHCEKEIKIVIDKSVLEKYYKHYFLIHPKAKKKPIEKPQHPSINQWMVMRRPQMNQVKGKWKDFMVWLMEYYGYSNRQIDKCNIEYTTYFPTKARHDPDNTSPKFLMDGLVESGFLVDDDGEHVLSLKLICKYDKENPRTEILVTNIGVTISE